MSAENLAVETTPNNSWAPSAELRSTVSTAMWATLVVGIILIAESGLALLKAQGLAEAITHGLGWVALIPAFWLVRAYSKLGEETGYGGLRSSSICLFGALILFQVFDLLLMETLPSTAQMVLWVVFVLGWVIVLFMPFCLMAAAAVATLREKDKALIVAESAKLETGARVLGNFQKSGTWYPGSLQSIQENAFQMAYDDGDEETLTAESVVAETLITVDKLAIGDRVFARWADGACYYMGDVIGLRSGEVEVRYDDGDEEWTKLDVVRLSGLGDSASAAVAPGTSTTPETPQTPEKKNIGSTIAAVVGFLIVAVPLIFKAVGKGAAKVVIRRAHNMIPDGLGGWELVGLGVMGLFLLTIVVYFVWFAVAKIIARSHLGAIGLLLGLAELLGFVTVIAVVGWFGVQFGVDVNQPGITEEQVQQLEHQFRVNIVPFEIVCSLVWVLLTMLLFWSLRHKENRVDLPQASGGT